LSRLIFCAGIAFSGRFERRLLACLRLDFFNGKFQYEQGLKLLDEKIE
jgi:hypothetical protein